MDYIKVDPSNGFVTQQSSIVTSSTMTAGNEEGKYYIQTTDAAGNALALSFEDRSGVFADYSETVTSTLDSTDLSTTISDQVEIRADTSSVQRYDW